MPVANEPRMLMHEAGTRPTAVIYAYREGLPSLAYIRSC
jgi:hypothetical protein